MNWVASLVGALTLEDGSLVRFSVNGEGVVQRWGGTTEQLAASVDATEAVRDALVDFLPLVPAG